MRDLISISKEDTHIYPPNWGIYTANYCDYLWIWDLFFFFYYPKILSPGLVSTSVVTSFLALYKSCWTDKLTCIYTNTQICVCALRHELLSVLFEGQLALEHINCLSLTASNTVTAMKKTGNERTPIQFHSVLYHQAIKPQCVYVSTGVN